MSNKLLLVLVSLSFILTACAPAVTQVVMMDKPTEVMGKSTEVMEKPTEEMTEETTSDVMASEVLATPESMLESEMMENPAWFNSTLTNVRSAENLTINDYKGKVVLVETLAMWCPTCKKQQVQVQALHEMLGTMGDDLVSIGLDIDPNEVAADLKTYTEANGFDWIYAVAPADVIREIAQLYGEKFLNPPSAPILIIGRDGQVHPMLFGLKSAEELKNFIEPFLSEGM